MNMALRQTLALLLGMALGVGFSASASAEEAVLQAVAVRVSPGEMDEYLSRVKKLQGMMDRLETGSSMEVWQVTAAGPGTGTTLVVLEYPSLVGYAEGTVKTQEDEELQELIGDLDELRTIQSSSLYRQVSGPGRERDVPTGSVLQTVSVRVKPGRLDDYIKKTEKLRKISERVGATNTIRVWQATAAGETTGTVVVGLLYKDLATYAAESTKVQADAEWQKVVGGLHEMRTIVSTGLAQNVGP